MGWEATIAYTAIAVVIPSVIASSLARPGRHIPVTIDPLVVGGGKRIFRDDGALRPLWLDESQVTTTGAILATYASGED